MNQYPYKIPIIGGDRELEFVIADGAYFAYDAPPGQYFLESFVVTKPVLKTVVFRLVMLGSDDKSNEQEIRDSGVITVKPKELVFVGSQAVSIKSRPGLFRKGETNIGPTDSPSEKEVLQKILPSLAGTSWESEVKDRLAALNQERPKEKPQDTTPVQPLTIRPRLSGNDTVPRWD